MYTKNCSYGKFNPKNQYWCFEGSKFPTGSVKYAAALGMFAELQNHQHTINHNGGVFAATSGNTGIAASQIFSQAGFQFTAVVDTNIELEKVAAIKKQGGNVVTIHGGIDDRMRTARELAAKYHGVDLNQYENPGAIIGNYYITGATILTELKGIRIDILMCSIGTGGTLAGISAALIEHYPNCRVIAVDAFGSALTSGLKNILPRKLSGLGCNIIPENALKAFYFANHEPIAIKDRDAFLAARCFSRDTGISIGGSGGAVVCATAEYSQQVENQNIIMIFHDSGAAYQLTIYNDHWMKDNGFL